MGFINNDHTYNLSTLFKSTNTQPLYVHRLKQIACKVFRIVDNMSPDYINELVKIKISNYDFREERKADVPRVNIIAYGVISGLRQPGYGTAYRIKYDWSNSTSHNFVGWPMPRTALDVSALFNLPLCMSTFV